MHHMFHNMVNIIEWKIDVKFHFGHNFYHRNLYLLSKWFCKLVKFTEKLCIFDVPHMLNTFGAGTKESLLIVNNSLTSQRYCVVIESLDLCDSIEQAQSLWKNHSSCLYVYKQNHKRGQNSIKGFLKYWCLFHWLSVFFCYSIGKSFL